MPRQSLPDVGGYLAGPGLDRSSVCCQLLLLGRLQLRLVCLPFLLTIRGQVWAASCKLACLYRGESSEAEHSNVRRERGSHIMVVNCCCCCHALCSQGGAVDKV
eukprot:1294962-Amphidinium_carterae.1